MLNAQDAVSSLKMLDQPLPTGNLVQDDEAQKNYWTTIDTINRRFHDYLRATYGEPISHELHQVIISNAMSYSRDVEEDYKLAECYYREMALMAKSEYKSPHITTDKL